MGWVKYDIYILTDNYGEKLTIYNHAQLGFPDKSRAIKGLVVCWMLLNLRSLGVRVLHPITSG